MLLTLPEEHRYFLPPDSSRWQVIFANFRGVAAADLIRAMRERFGSVVKLDPKGQCCVSSTMRSGIPRRRHHGRGAQPDTVC